MVDLVMDKQQLDAAGKGVPAGWVQCKLGDALTLQRGFDLPQRLRKEGSIPIISSSGESGWHNKAIISPPGIVTGRYGTIGEVFFIDRPFWPLNTTLYVREFNGITPFYAYFLLKTVDFQSHSGKSGVPGVNRNDVHQENILLPPIKEQIAISTTLSNVDELISALERLLSKKQAIKTATMQQLLTGKTRLPQFALRDDGTAKGYKKSELGDIPEDWDNSTYGQVFSFLATSTNARSDLSDTGECGYIHYGDIHTKWNNNLNLENSSVPRISSDLVSSSFIKDGDLIMADASEDYAGIGKSIEIQGVRDNIIVAGLHTYLLRDMNNIFVNGFRGYLHCIRAVKANIDRLATGMKVFGVSKNNLKTIPIPVPPKEEQTAIAAILSDMDKEIQTLQQRLDKTRQLKQGMMQELLTGKTRLI
ncbi:restriction endonuclease subunit S [Salmonella enterica]|nr:restriction endonuclease subunit S [Salmonella enterica subsp. enterica]EKP4812669.1 restriction endonuclease subunit S [Salmonella enterica]EKP5941289.1 restriction endonuclease subunit S [Salmonella enterica]ELN0971275.1 restriction endonuclease subunit S [Salmonella enterica]